MVRIANSRGGFQKALALTLKKEGGYVNDSLNKGGETYRGVHDAPGE